MGCLDQVCCWFVSSYFGFFLGHNPRFLSFWDPVVGKIRKRLSSWKRRFFSKDGRLTFIQSVLSGIPIYFLYLFRISVVVSKCLEKFTRDFPWEEVEEG